MTDVLASRPPAALARRLPTARATSAAVLVLLLATFTLLALTHWPDEVDDVYIDALHARNLVEHGVIRLGSGEGPVEGFSSPLNVGLHALAFALHLPGVIASRPSGTPLHTRCGVGARPRTARTRRSA